jgi:predicted dienelactone hydrolase
MRNATSLQQFLARVEDVKFALDELARRDADANWPLHGKLDLKQIAMAGHSFGAVTTQAMCGQIFKGGTLFFDPRIKAGIVFSPSPPKTGDAKEAFAHMTLPMFYWTGTKDQVAPAISTVTPDQRRIPFDATTGNDRYLVILTDGNHMVFNGPPREAAEDQTQVTAWHTLICKGTTAFLDKYLKSDPAQAKYLDDGDFAKDAAALGTFEMKRADKE